MWDAKLLHRPIRRVWVGLQVGGFVIKIYSNLGKA